MLIILSTYRIDCRADKVFVVAVDDNNGNEGRYQTELIGRPPINRHAARLVHSD